MPWQTNSVSSEFRNFTLKVPPARAFASALITRPLGSEPNQVIRIGSIQARQTWSMGASKKVSIDISCGIFLATN
jgi:hypothetical protein